MQCDKVFCSQAQKKKDKATFYSPFCEVDYAGRIHNNPRRKRVCGRFRSKHAHGQQERPKLSGIGDLEDIEKSDNGSDSQRQIANKRRGNGIRP